MRTALNISGLTGSRHMDGCAMNHRRVSKSRAAGWPGLAALLLLGVATTCFSGDDLVDQPCRSDDDCNPLADALGRPLRCEHEVCGYMQRCGDGIVDEMLEECDEGMANLESDYGSKSGDCSASECRLLPYCGDKVVYGPREACDDGNRDNHDVCLDTCQAAACGDGFVGPGEACDPKADQDCTDACARPSCGDGLLQGDEQCDDGNSDDIDDCLGTCLKTGCGDAIVQQGEQCDDGNTVDTDDCLGSCLQASCGDGFAHDGVESCDDGNNDNTDDCLDSCKAASCGDDLVHQDSEQCDDGNNDDDDGCSSTCKHENCGDGVKQSSESCDDGNVLDDDGCSAGCTFESCGDELIQGQEQCDDGNASNTDDCVACILAQCGDGVTWEGHEQCDDGNDSQSDGCLDSCELAACGDGQVMEGVEACDDGDADDTDECTSTCEFATCGDGLVWAGQEACDDGNASNGDPCLNTCVANVCGDGFVDATAEGCDDTNGDNNDGCSNTCRLGPVGFAASASDHTCVLRQGGVRCWGANSFGKLGYGYSANVGDELADLPLIDVNAGLPGELAVGVAAGDENTCAVFATGAVRCWGAGDLGMLGLGYPSQSLGAKPGDLPTPAVELGGVAVAVGIGGQFACALLDTGGVRCWGYNLEGQTGHPGPVLVGDTEKPSSLGDVSLGAKATQIAVGRNHACALLVGGSVRCWGRNSDGRLGIGSTATIGDNEVPTAVPPANIGGAAVQIAAGGAHTCALLATGKLRCWGLASSGQLGYKNLLNIGDNEAPAAAGDVKMLDPLDVVTKIVLGNIHTCALLADGAIRCWGNGVNGNLGYESSSSLGDDPADVSLPVDAGGQVRDLRLGIHTTCALLEGGVVRCWGFNGSGQLGIGNTGSVGNAPGDMPPQDAILYANP